MWLYVNMWGACIMYACSLFIWQLSILNYDTRNKLRIWHVTTNLCKFRVLFSFSSCIFLSSQLQLGNSWLSLKPVSVSVATLAPALAAPPASFLCRWRCLLLCFECLCPAAARLWLLAPVVEVAFIRTTGAGANVAMAFLHGHEDE